jgi:signal transduction histidine kinase/ligand-binding sensor domain-containing protein
MSHSVPNALGAGAIAVFAVTAARLAPAQDPAAIPQRDPRLSVERLARRLDWRDGLPGSYVSATSQDREGFLWVSGPSGVARYDGRSFTIVYSNGGVVLSGSTTGGRTVFCGADGKLHEAVGTTVVDLEDPPGGPSEGGWAGAVAKDGAIWWQSNGNLWRRPLGGAWEPVALAGQSEDRPHAVFASLHDDVFVTTRHALLRVASDGTSRVLSRIGSIAHVIERADGSFVIGANQDPAPVTTRVFEVRDGRERLLLERNGARLIGLVERGRRLWIATDVGLFGVAEGEPSLFIGTDETFHAAGGAFVDREGSLWVATFRGLVQIPEPETYAASLMKVARSLVHEGPRSWLSSWGVLGRFEDGPAGLNVTSFGAHFGILCRDARGRIWTQGIEGLSRVDESTLTPVRGVVADGTLASCTLGPSGVLWMSFAPGHLVVVRPTDDIPHELATKPSVGDDAFDLVREDAQGTLWAAGTNQMCRAPAEAVLRGGSVDWRCEPTFSRGDISDVAIMPSGDVWISTPSGISRRKHGRWELLAGNRLLRSRWIHAMRPSSSGGIWIVAVGALTRVVERPGTPDGFEVVEDLTGWHGVPTINAADVAEDPDGTLWFATDAGLMKLPAEVRKLRPEPPAVALIEATADGRALPADREVELPYRRNRLEMRFAALSFRDPTAVRYRHRSRPDEAWSLPTSDPFFRFVGLAPGRYRIEVEASVDGERWSATPATFAFRVLKPWYLQAWFFAAATLATAAILTLVYRLRVRTLLRLERQRTRIAMDLHDDVGSGLGTISVLAGLVGRPDVAPAQRDEFAARMATVSRELSQALGDIVWSLRPESGTLDAAWNQIVDRARPLFATGAPRLEVSAAETVPALPLSVIARRSLFLIAIEGLHNAARHSGATRVTLELHRAGSEWALIVTDDGRGISAASTSVTRRGLGLDGMRARACDMGGAITWDEAPGGGTRVVLRFRPDSD